MISLDKFAHYAVGMTLALLVMAMSMSIPLSVAAAALAGAGKVIYDRSVIPQDQFDSWEKARDFLATLIGGLVAAACMDLIVHRV